MLTLRLRNAWGEPKDWPLEDKADEAIARQALERLGEFAVDDPEAQEQVLLADDDGGPVGAWNKEGARRFAAELDSAQSLVLQNIRQDLLLAVSAG